MTATTTTPCTAPQTGLSFSSAPEKRQIERPTVPESDGIFMPGIRPDSGCCSKPVSRNAGAGGMRVPQGRAPLSIAVSQTRQFPAPRRF